jgi:hypothetical protein
MNDVNCLICKSALSNWEFENSAGHFISEYTCRKCIVGTQLKFDNEDFSYRFIFIRNNLLYILNSFKGEDHEYVELKNISRDSHPILYLKKAIPIDKNLPINEQMNKIIEEIFNLAVFA